MTQLLEKTMMESKVFLSNKDAICSQILGLVFANQLVKVSQNIEAYLYPYIAKVKLLEFTRAQMTEMHPVNIKNAFDTFADVMSGQRSFSQADSSVKGIVDELNKELRHFNDIKYQILKRLLGYGREVTGIGSYKNFEH